MQSFLGIDNWANPSLAIPSSLWESIDVGYGFLTPTPILISDDVIRVFGGVRDNQGRSAIHWVDIDARTLKVMDYARFACFDTRDSLDFDTDGAILGDIESQGSKLLMYYIGFKKSAAVKFQAFTGLAESTDFGKSWVKVPAPFSYLHENFLGCDIFAIHSARRVENRYELYVAVGTGWEYISGKQFPRYKSFTLEGEDFDTLTLSSIPVLPDLVDVYRLGRPRLFHMPRTGQEILIATGGKPSGDYRPYVFSKLESEWCLDQNQFCIEPGYSADFSLQVSYPALIEYKDRVIVFFNGDQMGRRGAFTTIGAFR
jgi:hypothetical protein